MVDQYGMASLQRQLRNRRFRGQESAPVEVGYRHDVEAASGKKATLKTRVAERPSRVVGAKVRWTIEFQSDEPALAWQLDEHIDVEVAVFVTNSGDNLVLCL